MALQQGDLKDCIDNVISIDVYKPKLMPDNIVVCFKILDSECGIDLRYFIDKGSFDTVDTEVSLYPSDDNRYSLFVEFERNDKFPEHLLKLIKYIEKLANQQEWKFTSYLYDIEPVELNAENIKKFVRLTKLTDSQVDTYIMLTTFFKGYLTDIHANTIKLKTYDGDLNLKYIGETNDDLLERFVVENDIDVLQQEKIEVPFLSDLYHILNLGEYLVIRRTDTDKTLMFKQL